MENIKKTDYEQIKEKTLNLIGQEHEQELLDFCTVAFGNAVKRINDSHIFDDMPQPDIIARDCILMTALRYDNKNARELLELLQKIVEERF